MSHVKMLQSINPANEELLAERSQTPDPKLNARLQMAQETFLAWRQTPFSERAARFTRLSEILRTGQSDFALLMTHEMGKPIQQAEAEIEKCALTCEFYASHGEAFLQPREVRTEAKQSYVRYDPLGVVLAVMPWNFPYWQVYRAAVPAIAGGNTFFLKHAENVSGVALKIEENFLQAGFPAGTFTTVLLSRDRIEDLIADPAIRGVTLTGSERAGRSVAAVAGKHLKPTVLELGGSDPFVILADADLTRVVPQAVQARTQNTGQSCIAAKRFLVDQAIAAQFEEAFVSAMKQLSFGDPSNREHDLGPLARGDLRDQLHQQVQKTLNQGGRLCCGGRVPSGKGFYYEPTVLADVRPGMAAFDEETFGPVAAIIPFKSDMEAIALANATTYGLGASLWTSDADKASQFIPQVAAGAVFINEIVRSDPRLPFGGIKRSGYGRELGREGLRAFLNQKSVWVN